MALEKFKCAAAAMWFGHAVSIVSIGSVENRCFQIPDFVHVLETCILLADLDLFNEGLKILSRMAPLCKIQVFFLVPYVTVTTIQFR